MSKQTHIPTIQSIQVDRDPFNKNRQYGYVVTTSDDTITLNQATVDWLIKNPANECHWTILNQLYDSLLP